MANWSGVYTNPNPTGTSTGLNGSNTLNDTTASWGVNALVNQYIRITGGTGTGEFKLIIANTATSITISGSWGTIPDITSTYEIVLKFENNDHITGIVYLDAGMISELEDSADILFDGNYKINIRFDSEIRWDKAKSTLATFKPNNQTIQGTWNFFGGLFIDSNATGDVNISYIRGWNCTSTLQIEPCTAFGDGSKIHHIIAKDNSSYFVGAWGSALTEDAVIENVLVFNSTTQGLIYPQSTSAFSITYKNFWVEGMRSKITWGAAASSQIQILQDCIIKKGIIVTTTYINTAVKEIHYIDNYIESHIQDCYLSLMNNKGQLYNRRNVLKLGYEIINSSGDVDTKIYSSYNDYVGHKYQSQPAIKSTAGASETIESDNDYIAGRNEGSANNIDTTELTTSTHSPSMYSTLSSARTNAKTTLNKLLELDNIRESDLTASSVKIKFDCKNSNAGTTIDQDSNSGQKILYVASTTEFQERETIEIGFGTARYETGVIDSINAGVSITLKENLTYTHTLVQADEVTKRLRNLGLGFVIYGESAIDLNMASHLPDESSWGYLYNGFAPEIEEDDGYTWNYIDLEVDLEGLNSGTTYYYQVFAYTPLGDLMSGASGDFTTSAQTDYTDPGIANVRESTGYKFDGADLVGTLDLPVIANVRDGVDYDNSTKTGILDLPAITDVRDSVFYDNSTKEGVLNIPVIGDVRDGVFYDDGTKEGLLDLPLETVVLTGIIYDNGTKTGSLSGGTTPSDIYDYFVDASREDAFKADVSALATESNATSNKDEIIVEINANETKIDALDTLVKRILGLTQENFRIFDPTYNTSKQLLTATVKIYPSATDTNNDTNEIAEYDITTTYDVLGKMETYKSVKV